MHGTANSLGRIVFILTIVFVIATLIVAAIAYSMAATIGTGSAEQEAISYLFLTLLVIAIAFLLWNALLFARATRRRANAANPGDITM